MTDAAFEPTEPDDGSAAFAAHRGRLFGIAYRMLGSAAEADDVVQDVWLKWHAADRSTVRNTSAFLTTMTTRVAITVAQSARVRRESYVGTWLPEPVDTSADPTLGAETSEALEFAVLVLLEGLSPTERAAYVLREAFDYSYQEIAEIINVTDVNARQLVSRGRKRVQGRPRYQAEEGRQERLLTSFVDAARNGNLAVLEALLASDVVSLADGGGVVRAARVPVVGRQRVCTLVVKTSATFWAETLVTVIHVNGKPSMLVSRNGAAVGVLDIAASADGIEEIYLVANPSKLLAVSALLNAPDGGPESAAR